MSMISEQVNKIRKVSKCVYLATDKEVADDIASTLNQAADTIESLSAKLQAANMERSDRYYNGGWIACEDRLPNQGGIYYLITAKENALYHVTFAKWQPRYKEWDLRGCRSHWKVIAWKPLAEPYCP